MTASTGIAACNVNGVTIHKFMGIMDWRYGNEEIKFKIMNVAFTMYVFFSLKLTIP